MLTTGQGGAPALPARGGVTMGWFVESYRSALGKKAVMAVTGFVLFGFVFVHMVGNLKLYLGPEKLNHYGEFLREVGAPVFLHGQVLWIFRAVLLLCVVLHMHCAWVLTRASWAARPIGYREQQAIQSTYAARTVRWGGVIIAAFVLYHLAHLTLGWTTDGFQPGKPYENVVAGFQVPWIAGFYIVANLALGLHLYHGIWSLFQTLGWNSPGFNPWRRRFAAAFAVIITAGNVSFPVAVLAGFVR